MQISELLTYVAPGKEWALIGDPQDAAEYAEALTWVSAGKAPTWAELQAAEPQAQYDADLSTVKELRFLAYQRESDPLNYTWQETQLDVDRVAWLEKKDEIKARYPEPTPPA